MALNLSSLTSRMVMLLVLTFVSSLAIIYWIINQQAKPEVAVLSSQTIIETGNESVNGIMARLNELDGIALSASRLTEGLPKDAKLIQDSFGHLLAHTDSNIIGGGVWFDPSMYRDGVEEQAFVWRRNRQGEMMPDPNYTTINPFLSHQPKLAANNPATPSLAAISASANPTASAPVATDTAQPATKLATPYYRDWWYVPAMYANHEHCVWSRAYIQASSNLPMVTCAKAFFNVNNSSFEGVVSLDVLLTHLQSSVEDWQKKTGGYVFLVDMNNNFLTFPNESLVKQVTQANPQGEMMGINAFAKQHPSFAPIAQSLTKINESLIAKAKKMDEGRFEHVSNTIVSTTNLQRTTPDEAEILTALLFTNGQENINLNREHFVEQVAIGEDMLLHKPATAFIFAMPYINWKMVIVKPDQELLAFANHLGRQLQWYMLLGFIPVLLLSGYIFRRIVATPLRRVAREVQAMGQLIEQKRYLALNEHKLPTTDVAEISVISDSMNQLIDRVVENEGTLAQINEHLEQQVIERTEHLDKALTDLKASQVQLVQAEKMSTLGQMVAGVAHEVNTPLGYVSSNLELIEGNLARYQDLVDSTQQLKTTMNNPDAADSEVEAAIEQTLRYSDELVADELHSDLQGLIEDAQFGVSQISELVVNLRDFSRLDQAKIKAVNINDCINSSLIIAKNNIKNLEVVTELDSHSEVSCNPSQINQVLLNLFNNAAQAMKADAHGKLIVASLEDADNVYVKVSDNGCGMPPEVMANIFEPFFTTKPAGEGTGLGLAICSQIMEQHHGDIKVASTVGEGTTFTLRLPKTSRTTAPAKPLAIID